MSDKIKDSKIDLVVIGAGPAGYEAAEHAAKLGLSTLLIEENQWGGTCLNRGCIPTKTLIHSVEAFRHIQEEAYAGVEVSGLRMNLEKLQERKDQVVETLRQGVIMRMKKNKVSLIQGKAKILSPGKVLVEGEEIACNTILIATGSSPLIPNMEGKEYLMTSDDVLGQKEALDSLVIIGGGVIGMEFASIYNDLGTKVTVIEAQSRLLANTDREISRSLSMVMKKRGIALETDAFVEKIIQLDDGRKNCIYKVKGEEKEVTAQAVLVAVGRKANTEGLFSEDLPIELEKGKIVVDENFQTTIPTIYAAGDVIGGVQLAHVATAEAICAVDAILGKKNKIDFKVIPSCIYTDPEIAFTGIDKDQAKDLGMEVWVRKYPMSANGKSLLTGQERGFIKIVSTKEEDILVGAQLMCARATDMIPILSSAIVAKTKVEDLERVIFPHPTFSEGIMEALKL